MIITKPSFCLFDGKKAFLFSGIRDSDNLSVLIKTFNIDNISKSKIARLKQEFAGAQGLKTDGSISLFNIGYGKDCIAMVTEDFRGVPLKEYFKSRKLDILQFFDAVVDNAKADLDKVRVYNMKI